MERAAMQRNVVERNRTNVSNRNKCKAGGDLRPFWRPEVRRYGGRRRQPLWRPVAWSIFRRWKVLRLFRDGRTNMRSAAMQRNVVERKRTNESNRYKAGGDLRPFMEAGS